MRLLEEQALVPILGTKPIELGLKGSVEHFLSELGRDPVYLSLANIRRGSESVTNE